MSEFELLTILLSAFALVVLPTLALIVRLIIKGTRTDDKLIEVVEDVKKLTENHDRRLRWLEENFWRRR